MFCKTASRQLILCVCVRGGGVWHSEARLLVASLVPGSILDEDNGEVPYTQKKCRSIQESYQSEKFKKMSHVYRNVLVVKPTKLQRQRKD